MLAIKALMPFEAKQGSAMVDISDEHASKMYQITIDVI